MHAFVALYQQSFFISGKTIQDCMEALEYQANNRLRWRYSFTHDPYTGVISYISGNDLYHYVPCGILYQEGI